VPFSWPRNWMEIHHVIHGLERSSNESTKGFPCKALWRNGWKEAKLPQQTEDGAASMLNAGSVDILLGLQSTNSCRGFLCAMMSDGRCRFMEGPANSSMADLAVCVLEMLRRSKATHPSCRKEVDARRRQIMVWCVPCASHRRAHFHQRSTPRTRPCFTTYVVSMNHLQRGVLCC